MDIVVNEDLKAYIDPLTPDEHDALERSLLAEGCRDALVLWGNMLVDGHNRYGICQKHGLPFQTVQNTRFKSIEDVHLWMIDQHLGRRSLSDYQRGVLALRKREIVAERRSRLRNETAPDAPSLAATSQPEAHAAEAVPAVEVPAGAASPEASSEMLSTREALARAARLSSNQVALIEKIEKDAAPEVVAAVKSGTISLNAAAAVASLPVDEQVAAASGGKDELKQAAKRAREAKRKTADSPPKENSATDEASLASGDESVDSLRQQVSTLQAENKALRDQVARLELALRAAESGQDASPPF